VSALQADIWADLVAWALTTAPVFLIHHVLLKRHMTRITRRQTGHFDRITADQTAVLSGRQEEGGE
jgi:hypothetical protein